MCTAAPGGGQGRGARRGGAAPGDQAGQCGRALVRRGGEGVVRSFVVAAWHTTDDLRIVTCVARNARKKIVAHEKAQGLKHAELSPARAHARPTRWGATAWQAHMDFRLPLSRTTHVPDDGRTRAGAPTSDEVAARAAELAALPLVVGGATASPTTVAELGQNLVIVAASDGAIREVCREVRRSAACPISRPFRCMHHQNVMRCVHHQMWRVCDEV